MQPSNIEQRVDDLDSQLRAHLVWHDRQEDKLDAILEYVRDIPEMKEDIRSLKDRMSKVEIKLDVISSVVKDHSKDLKDIRHRVGRLESNRKV